MKLNFIKCRGRYHGHPVRSVLVLEPGSVPTTSYYAKSRIPEGVHYQRLNSLKVPKVPVAFPKGTWVIIVRHASRRWLRTLSRHREGIARVTYLKDDDIAAVFSATHLPWYYSLWTGFRFLWIRGLLGMVVSDVAVSTDELAARYQDVKPEVWEPHYDDSSEMTKDPCIYFYHANIVHFREMKWLVPVVRRVQKAVPEAWFEIIGDGSVARLFKGIPRVRVLHPLSWPDYQEYLASVRYQVGLAPLLDTPYNRARSHTKLYQITRAGAAGIYSNVIPYSGKIVDGVTGVLCNNHRYLWVRSIVALLKDAIRRAAIRENARIWCQEHHQEKAVEGVAYHA
jgi:hypothetical protein